MIATITICIVTCLVMILSILFFPKIKIGKFTIGSYWIITLVGAIILLASLQVDVNALGNALVSNSAINPIKILVLFLSMTILSIFLDELGFFRYVANVTLKKSKGGQKRLFILLYCIVSLLTIFTSNDIIILSFTPFICYFAKNAKIDPVPYLAAEFIAANTWSMALIIGNPTNIYLATACSISFVDYLKVSLVPTIFAGIVSFFILYLLFRKKLSAPIQGEAEEIQIKNKVLLWIGIVHLAVCTILLAISSYVGIEMWLVSLCSVGSLFVSICIATLIQKQKPIELWACLKRTPFQLVPFVLSMFVLIVALSQHGVTAYIGNFLGIEQPVLTFGFASFFAANLMNNIPMSVLFSSVIESMSGAAGLGAVYATIIGSNIGAFLTPIGALAGIMWTSILNKHDVKFSYWDFIKIGFIVSIPTMFASLGGLYLMLAI